MAFEYTIDSAFDYTIDEKGNRYIALRKIDWGNKGEYKLDLRKYYASETGEKMSSGVTMTDDAADELTKVLLETGYGDDDDITNILLETRKSIAAKIAVLVNDPNSKFDLTTEIKRELENEEEFYDPEELI